MGRKSYSEDLTLEEAALLEQERENARGLFGQTLPPVSKEPPPIAQGPMLPSVPIQDMEESVITASPLKYADAPVEKPQADAPMFKNPMVAEHVAKKVLGDDYSPERLKEIIANAENRASNPGLLIAQAFQGFGDSLARRNPAQSMDTFDGYRKDIRKNAIDDFERGRKVNKEQIEESRTNDLYDPKSARSISFRKSMEQVAPKIAEAYGDDWQNVTAQDQKLIFDPVKLKLEMDARQEQRKIDAQNAQSFARQRADSAKDRAFERTQARQDKLDKEDRERLDKKKAVTNEVEDRRQNIMSNVTELDRMITENGTWELFGSHNQDMDRLAEQIQTDMAKLMDPSSVARPSEVEAVKKSLVQPGLRNSNSTARDILKNFKNEVNRRQDNAYKIRGVDLPVAPPESSQGSGRSVVKKQYSKSANKTKLIYSDGSEEIVDGQQ